MSDPTVVVPGAEVPVVVPPTTEPVVEKPTTEPEATVPISRFKEVYDEKKRLSEEVAKYKTTLTAPVAPVEKDEETRRAEEFVLKTIKDNEEASTREEEEAVAQETTKLDERIDFFKSVDPSTDEKVLMGLIEKYDLDYTVDSQGREVHPYDKAYKIWKDMSGAEKTAAEKSAASARTKPTIATSPRNDGTDHPVTNTSNKSFSEIAEEIKNEIPV